MQKLPKLSERIIGFAGEDYPEGRKQAEGVGESTYFQAGQFEVWLYHSPAVKDYHLPQDALGVFWNRQDPGRLYFGLADGVTSVGGMTRNQSGQLAKEIIFQIDGLGQVSEEEWEAQLAELSWKYRANESLAASTVVWGKLSVSGNSDKVGLVLLLVGSQHDLGMLKVVQGKTIEDLPDESKGFVPDHYATDFYRQRLPVGAILVVSSDGIVFDNGAIIRLTEDRPTEREEFSRLIARLGPPSPDDQSLLMIKVGE